MTFVTAVQLARSRPSVGTTDVVLRDALRRCEQAVYAGREIGPALEQTGAFAPSVVQTFSVGQASGQLEGMLEQLAADYDREVTIAAQRLTAMLAPVIILLLAVVVGFIAFATIVPILQAGQVL